MAPIDDMTLEQLIAFESNNSITLGGALGAERADIGPRQNKRTKVRSRRIVRRPLSARTTNRAAQTARKK